MRKLKCTAMLAALLLAVTILGGCGSQQLRLTDIAEVSTVSLDNGADLTLPDSWEMLSMTEDSAVFVNGDNSLSLGIARELAGFSYYSPEGLADLGEELLGSTLDDMQVLEREQLGRPQNAVLVTASGKLADGDAVAQAVVISPLSAVRYFIVVTAQSDTFGEYEQVLRDIYAGFALNMTEDEIYELLPED